MYAVIETGGKQVKAQAGDFIEIEKLEGDVGTVIVFDKVLMVSQPGTDDSTIDVGTPYLAQSTVTGEIVAQGRGEKLTIIKMKRRKGYRRTQGHRQDLTQLLITSVQTSIGKTALADAEKAEKINAFFTNLKPKGLAQTPKTLGSRKKLKEAALKLEKQNSAE